MKGIINIIIVSDLTFDMKKVKLAIDLLFYPSN